MSKTSKDDKIQKTYKNPYSIKIGALDPLGKKENPLNNKSFSDQYKTLQKKVKSLPANQSKTVKEFFKKIDSSKIILLSGETGSGKSTQIPRYLLHYFNYKKRIICTQPRQLAVSNVSDFVAKLLDVELGKEVGYQFRFQHRVDDSTKLTFMTDGSLLQKLIKDPSLSKYSGILIDEAHERSVRIDLILLLLKKICENNLNPDLKIIIMSATADIDTFHNYFKDFNPVFMSIEGRTFPVKHIFSKSPIKNYIEYCVDKTIDILEDPKSKKGDILIFLPGSGEINEAYGLLESLLKKKNIKKIFVAPLYSTLSKEMQSLATDPQKYKKHLGQDYTTKIVLATDIAEASVTIDGIIYVIESGYRKENFYRPKLNANELILTHISQASVKQRIGRAGRTRPGIAYSAYTQSEFENFREFSLPEFNKINIISEVLNLMSIPKYLKDISKLRVLLSELISPPPTSFIETAISTLVYLHALDEKGKITDIGCALSKFSISPQISKMILASCYYDCLEECCILGGMLSQPSYKSYFISAPLHDDDLREKINQSMRYFRDNDGDHFSLIDLYKEFAKHYSENDQSKVRNWCKKNLLSFYKIHEAHKTIYQLKSTFQLLLKQKKIPLLKVSIIKCKSKKDNIIKSLLHGFFQNIATKLEKDGLFTLLKYSEKAMPFYLRHKKWIIYDSIIIRRENIIEIPTHLPDPTWILEIAAYYFIPKEFKALQRIILRNLYREYPCNKLVKKQQSYRKIIKKICENL